MSTTISKKMLINVMHPEEARVAIVHDGRLMELNIEISGKEQTKGNVYKGVVLRVEPGLQAAFVDIGRAKPGFLQIGELHPDYWQWRDDIPEEQRKRRPRIQEVLRRGQELVVQIEKDERDNKGSALTTYLSLPGRYMVIMPGSDSTGVSRKVEQEGERKKLKAIVAELEIPEGIGYIIRTEAVGRSREELQKDLDTLVERYHEIRQQADELKGAGEIYQDSDLIIRTIRDYFSDDIDEVLVDSKEAYRAAKEFFHETMPKCEKRVKQHKEKRPIFSRYQLEEQIDQIYEKRVSLPSGGYLIIEPTEALVSIDVNSGKTSGERGVEDTAFKTNMEAAEEVARQLRLRDLGGLIVIDFIDMRDNKHNKEVERVLKGALKMDKARVNVGRISEFGMLEMSRQRIAKTLNDAIHLACPHCEGRGKVKSVEAMALSFFRKVHAAAAKGTVAEVRGGLPLEVAYYLLNRKKRELTQIENEYEIEVTVKGKPSFTMNQLELETTKRETPRLEDVAKSDAEAEEAYKPIAPREQVEKTEAPRDEEQSDPSIQGEAGKKRKRRRKKKKPGSADTVAGAAVSAVTDSAGEDDGEAVITEPDASAVVPADEGHPDEEGVSAVDGGGAEEAHRKKRRRRRNRKGSKGQDGVVVTEVPDIEPQDIVVSEVAVAEVPQNTEPTEPAKPKRARAPRKKKDNDTPVVTEQVMEVVAVPEVEEAVAPVKKTRKAASRKKETVAPVIESEEAAAPESKELPKKRAPRPKRLKKTEEIQ